MNCFKLQDYQNGIYILTHPLCSMKTFDSSVKAKQKVSTHLTEEPPKIPVLSWGLKNDTL